jgi:hypothetical protein
MASRSQVKAPKVRTLSTSLPVGTGYGVKTITDVNASRIGVNQGHFYNLGIL